MARRRPRGRWFLGLRPQLLSVAVAVGLRRLLDSESRLRSLLTVSRLRPVPPGGPGVGTPSLIRGGRGTAAHWRPSDETRRELLFQGSDAPVQSSCCFPGFATKAEGFSPPGTSLLLVPRAAPAQPARWGRHPTVLSCSCPLGATSIPGLSWWEACAWRPFTGRWCSSAPSPDTPKLDAHLVLTPVLQQPTVAMGAPCAGRCGRLGSCRPGPTSPGGWGPRELFPHYGVLSWLFPKVPPRQIALSPLHWRGSLWAREPRGVPGRRRRGRRWHEQTLSE